MRLLIAALSGLGVAIGVFVIAALVPPLFHRPMSDYDTLAYGFAAGTLTLILGVPLGLIVSVFVYFLRYKSPARKPD